MLVVLNLDSFYTPAKCAFPDGKESWDGGHLTFVCYAMARVDADKEIQLDTPPDPYPQTAKPHSEP